MRALYEIKFVDKKGAVDLRTVIRPKTTKGFMSAAQWASEHCDKGERVAQIIITGYEQL